MSSILHALTDWVLQDTSDSITLCPESDFARSLCCSEHTEEVCKFSATLALGFCTVTLDPLARCPVQSFGRFCWKCAPGPGTSTPRPQHPLLLLQLGAASQRLLLQRGVLPTGHMDNHLKLIPHLCPRDGPSTSGSDIPPLLPQPRLKRSTKCCKEQNTTPPAPQLVGDPSLQADRRGTDPTLRPSDGSKFLSTPLPPPPSPSPQEDNVPLKTG